MAKKKKTGINEDKTISLSKNTRKIVVVIAKEDEPVHPWTIKGNQFNSDDEDDIENIEKYIKSVESTLSALQTIDVKTIAVFVAGAIGYVLSPTIPVLIPFATAAIAYGVQQIEERNKKYDAYDKALTELTKACEWIMKDVKKNTFEETIQNKTIARMLKMLAPITQASDLNDLKITDNDVKKSLVTHVDELKKEGVKFWDMNIEGQRKLKLFYKIYGKDQGVLSILAAVGQAIKDAFKYLFSSSETAKYSVQKSEPNRVSHNNEDDEAHGPGMDEVKPSSPSI